MPEDADLTARGQIGRDFLDAVGARIRSRRRAASMTVQELADRSGISRRLLTQIEHGQANPSLVAMTRVARQLGADVTELLADDGGGPGPVEVRSPGEHVLVWSSDAGSTAHLLVATDGGRTADLWSWTLVAGDRYDGRPDPARSQELFHVHEGELVLRVDGSDVRIPQGGSARLLSDRPYAYLNPGEVPSRFTRVVVLAPGPAA